MEWIFIGAGAIIGGLLLLGVYLLPILIAARKSHPHLMWIAILTILVGWSGLLWVIALLWSLKDGALFGDTNRPSTDQPFAEPGPMQFQHSGDDIRDIERLAQLKVDGFISEREFEAEKRKILNKRS